MTIAGLAVVAAGLTATRRRLAASAHLRGGSRSMEGFAQTAMLFTVIQTCCAQGRSAFECFKLVLTITNLSNPLDMPSLIPVLEPEFLRSLSKPKVLACGSPEFMVGARSAPTINSGFRLFNL